MNKFVHTILAITALAMGFTANAQEETILEKIANANVLKTGNQ